MCQNGLNWNRILVLASIKMQSQEFGIHWFDKNDYFEKDVCCLPGLVFQIWTSSFRTNWLQGGETKRRLLISAFVEKLAALLFFKRTELLQLFLLLGVKKKNP